MESRLRFLDYQWAHLAVATVACILGVISHLLILIFTSRSTKKDCQTYQILIKSYSILTIFGLLTGYLSGVRREDVPTGLAYIPYGPSRFLLPPRWVALLDALNIQIVPMIPMLLATMMVFRALIMFNFKLKKKIVYGVLLLIFLITLPINVIFVRNYIALEAIPLVNVSHSLLEEFHAGPCYGVQFDEILGLLWNLSHNLAMASILIGFITVFLMMWKLFRLLTLDLLIIVVFFFIMGSVYNFLSSQIADLVVMFTCPIFALCEGLQGLMSIIFVPYLRTSFIRMVKGKHLSIIASDHLRTSDNSPKTVSAIHTTYH